MTGLARRVAMGLVMLGMASGAAGATVVLQLGTSKRASDWSGSACGSIALPVFQFGDGIAVAGSLVTSSGRCMLSGGMIVTEYFYLPAGATNVRLRIDDFEVFGRGELQINSRPVTTLTNDGAGCAWVSGCKSAERGGRDRADNGGVEEVLVPTGSLVPGAGNSLSVAFGGGPPAGYFGGGTALLEATLSYEPPLVAKTAGPVVSVSAVPEPPTAVLLGVALGGLAFILLRRVSAAGATRK